MVRVGSTGVRVCRCAAVPLAVLRHREGEFVETVAEQLLAAAAVVSAVGVVDEAEPAVRPDPGDELGLRVDDRAIAGLAGAHRGLGRGCFGDVVLDRHEMGDAPGRVAQRRDGRVLVDERTVLAPVDDQALPVLAAGQLPIHVGKERGIMPAAAQHVLRQAPDHLDGLETGDPGKGRVDIGEPAFGVGDLDGIADLLDRHRQQQQLTLAAAALGDVGGEQHAPAIGHVGSRECAASGRR